jgi:uncharacterized damage-inducible protein DinB
MKQVKWFDRTFDFSFNKNSFSTIMQRLEYTPILLKNEIETCSKKQLSFKMHNKWSIKENIGHLSDLETIWLGRLDDILAGKKYLRTADLENKKTNLANHNIKSIAELIKEFENVRAKTIVNISGLNKDDINKFALHPRLNKPMKVIDLFYFVAEHDEHHLTKITNFKAAINS